MPAPSHNPDTDRRNTGIPGRWLAAGFASWIVAVSIPMTLLAAKHWSPLPDPVAKSRSPDAPIPPEPGWTILHVLVADCGCSRRLAGHLVGRKPDATAYESVVLIGPDPLVEARLARAGWKVRVLEESRAEAELGVEGGPFLLVYRPDGTPAYAGGHGPRPGAPAEWRDQALVQAARSGRPLDPLPVFGCGVSSRHGVVRRLTTLNVFPSPIPTPTPP